MYLQMRNIGLSLLTIGMFLLLATVFDVMTVSIFTYLILGIGLLFFWISALKVNSQASLLCRVGFHQYHHVAWDEDMQSVAIYRCKRCRNEKKVVSSV